MNTAQDIADLYADVTASIAALAEALQAKGLLNADDIRQAASSHLSALEIEHPYLILRMLAARDS